jgi:uncharacterized membrane protein
MENSSSLSSQEKLAAALASFLFFVPLLMNVKTAFIVKYMKQGFAINIAEILIAIISSFLWMLSPILALVNLALFITSIVLAIQAFGGKDYVITFLYENGEKLIQTLGIVDMFSPKK